MFKAVHRLTGEEIVVLEPKWRRNLNPLRVLARDDLLLCQGCRQPVRVRAPRFRRAHFAHKHLGNCAFGQLPPELLQARAVLYEWLLTQFGAGERGDAVSLEQMPLKIPQPEGSPPRPVDGWVNTGSATLAYWIVETRLKPADRQRLLAWAQSCGAQVHWIFLHSMLQEYEQGPGMTILTTTERAFLASSVYDQQDQAISRNRSRNISVPSHAGWDRNQMPSPVTQDQPGSLHYLDPETGLLTTFRGLRLAHSPQVFAGRKVQHEIGQVVASPQTGEFVHPGEAERLRRSRQEQAKTAGQAADRLRRLEELQARLVGRAGQPFQPAGEPVQRSPMQGHSNLASERPGEANPEKNLTPEVSPGSFTRPAKCISCGETTTDWVTYFGATRTCICRKCHQR